MEDIESLLPGGGGGVMKESVEKGTVEMLWPLRDSRALREASMALMYTAQNAHRESIGRRARSKNEKGLTFAQGEIEREEDEVLWDGGVLRRVLAQRNTEREDRTHGDEA